MPRKPLIRTAIFPYHITNRSNNKEHFYVKPDELWSICMEALEKTTKLFKCEIHCFVLMSNHYHLIVSTPEENIGDVMRYFQREVARQANKNSSRVNHFFGGRYKWSVIGSETYFWNAVKYVFRNPVEAGLCHRVEEFKYSSLNSVPKNFNWELTDVFYDRSKKIQLDLEWLNKSFTELQKSAVSGALRRREFKVSPNPSGFLTTLDLVRRQSEFYYSQTKPETESLD